VIAQELGPFAAVPRLHFVFAAERIERRFCDVNPSAHAPD
jgi:hypothetical protein